MYRTEAILVLEAGLVVLMIWLLWKVLWNALRFIFEFAVSMIRMIMAAASLTKSILYALLLIGGLVCTIGAVGVAVVVGWWCLTDVFAMMLQALQELPF